MGRYWQVIRTLIPRDAADREVVLEFATVQSNCEAMAIFAVWRRQPGVLAGRHRVKVVEGEERPDWMDLVDLVHLMRCLAAYPARSQARITRGDGGRLRLSRTGEALVSRQSLGPLLGRHGFTPADLADHERAARFARLVLGA
ncbi:hypothetical protein R8Z50_04640 [Longispora sp. K20-0274]|uniref:hypothetical protein n=1 Tax=Longispora sp. K20-0274 TaxID=3088255 RepID=UPI003999F0FD